MTLDKGYVTIDRTWAAGDIIDAQPADAGPPRRSRTTGDGQSRSRRAAARADRLRRRVARQPERQGPQHRPARRERADDGVPGGSAERRAGDHGPRRRTRRSTSKGAVQRAEQPFMAIPYATWANRGRGQMAVWLARTDAAARPTPYPTLATTSTVTASPLPERPRQEPAQHHRRRAATPRVLGRSRLVAVRLDRRAMSRCRGQRRVQQEWVEMTFAKPSTVSESRGLLVRRHRPRRRPRAGVLAAALQGRRRVDAGRDQRGSTASRRNAWNTVAFTPVTTAALRHRARRCSRRFSAGVQEWKVK